MEKIPVLNVFNGHMTVTHKSMVRLVSLGKCCFVFGPDGVERGLEWVFDGYRADEPGSDATRNGGRRAKLPEDFEAIFEDFSDAEPGMPILQFWTQQSNRPGVLIEH